MKYKKIILASIIAFALSFFVVSTARANPSIFLTRVQTSTATSSPTQIFIATATTTLVFDAYANYDPVSGDSGTLLIQQTASSTASVVSVFFEFSQDGIDYYADSLDLASTTAGISLNSDRVYTWGAATVNRSSKAIGFKSPTRFVRANIKQTAGTSTVWAEIIPKRQAK